MPRPRRHGTLPVPDEEAPPPRPRPSAPGCCTFLRCPASRRGYRRLDSSAAALRVGVGTSTQARSVFHADPAVLEVRPLRRLLAAAGRRVPGGTVAVAVDALLFLI